MPAKHKVKWNISRAVMSSSIVGMAKGWNMCLPVDFLGRFQGSQRVQQRLINLSTMPLPIGWYGVALVLRMPVSLHKFFITLDWKLAPLSLYNLAGNPQCTKKLSNKARAVVRAV